MLEDSLRRLQTDHLDVWQIHEVVYYNDPDLIFAPNGAIEALERPRSRESTLCRLHGAQGSGHSFEDALARLPVRYGADAVELLRRQLP